MQKNKTDFSAIILAAGLGKRMQSDLPKVLHKIGSKSMISRTVSTLLEIDGVNIITVASPENVGLLQGELGTSTQFAIQNKPLGTADALKSALVKAQNSKDIAVLYGDDTAFYKSSTIRNIYKKHIETSAKITFVTLIREDPKGLGRIVRKNGKLVSITEEKDASPNQKRIKEVNDGLYFFSLDWVMSNLRKLTPSRATGELYITDLIEIALREKTKVETYLLEDSQEWHGINDKEELGLAQQKITKSIHFMGIAGSGASAVAQIANANGFIVSGCDLNTESAYTSNSSIKALKGHSLNHLDSIDMLIISPAILKLDPENSELIKAKESKIPVLTWQEFQGTYLQKNKTVIAVAGAYGKSTTTSIVSQILIDQNLDPTCEIGAKIISWGQNYRVGKSMYYICEADEYNNNFLHYQPQIAIILNVAWDHPDFFPTRKSLIESYINFINNIRENGLLITTDEVINLLAAKIRKDLKVIRITNFKDVKLPLIGDFRSQNSDAALTLARVLNLDEDIAKKTLANFGGVARRLEQKGKIGKTIFFDDYAVQPYTIQKTISALQEKYKGKKILLVLEPHTNSRVETFFNDFVESLQQSEVAKIFITDIFTARESANKKNVLSKKLATSVGSRAQFTGSIMETASKVKKEIKNYDVVCSMGAGDSYKIFELVEGK